MGRMFLKCLEHRLIFWSSKGVNLAWACRCIIEVLVSIKIGDCDLEHLMCLDWRFDDKQDICSVVWASCKCNDSVEHELCPYRHRPGLSNFHFCVASYLLHGLDSCSGEDYQLVSKVYQKTRRLFERSDSSQVVLWYVYFMSCNLCECYMVETLFTGLSQSSESKWNTCLPDQPLTLVVFHQFSVLKIRLVMMIYRPRSN